MRNCTPSAYRSAVSPGRSWISDMAYPQEDGPPMAADRTPGPLPASAVAVALVAEETALLDQLADLGRHGRFPRRVVARDPAQHVTAEDRQVVGLVVVQGDE